MGKVKTSLVLMTPALVKITAKNVWFRLTLPAILTWNDFSLHIRDMTKLAK